MGVAGRSQRLPLPIPAAKGLLYFFELVPTGVFVFVPMLFGIFLAMG